jgi:hypothetical protein
MIEKVNPRKSRLAWPDGKLILIQPPSPQQHKQKNQALPRKGKATIHKNPSKIKDETEKALIFLKREGNTLSVPGREW